MHYSKILELKPNVRYTQDEVKQQYRLLAKKHHPDHGGSNVRMQELNQAYSILIEHFKTNVEYIFLQAGSTQNTVKNDYKKDVDIYTYILDVELHNYLHNEQVTLRELISIKIDAIKRKLIKIENLITTAQIDNLKIIGIISSANISLNILEMIINEKLINNPKLYNQYYNYYFQNYCQHIYYTKYRLINDLNHLIRKNEERKIKEKERKKQDEINKQQSDINEKQEQNSKKQEQTQTQSQKERDKITEKIKKYQGEDYNYKVIIALTIGFFLIYLMIHFIYGV